MLRPRPVVVEMVGDRAPLVRVLRRPQLAEGPPGQARQQQDRRHDQQPDDRPHRLSPRSHLFARPVDGSGDARQQRQDRRRQEPVRVPQQRRGRYDVTDRLQQAVPAGKHRQRREEERDPGEHQQPRAAGAGAGRAGATAVSAQLSSTMTAEVRSSGTIEVFQVPPSENRLGSVPSGDSRPGSERVEHLGTGVAAGVGEQRRQQPGQVGDDDQAGRHSHVREAAAQPEHHHDQRGHDAAGGAAHGARAPAPPPPRALRGAGRAASGATRAPPRAAGGSRPGSPTGRSATARRPTGSRASA